MSSGRRRYFTVAESVADESWNNDELAALIRLMARMNGRWASHGLTSDEAATIHLGPTEIMAISGKRRVDVALTSLRHLADVASMSVEHHGDIVTIKWPKFPIFQNYEGRRRSLAGRSESESESESESYPKKNKKEAPPAPPPAPRARSTRSKRRDPDPRAVEAWPAIRAAFAEHGAQLGESVGGDRADLLAKRFDAGATADDLVRAVHGYVRIHGLDRKPDGFDPRAYFRPNTVFKADGFSDRVDAGTGPRPTGSGVSKAAQAWGLR